MATVVIQKRIGKRGTSYAIRYVHPITGKWHYYKTCKKKKDANFEANDLRRSIDFGKVPAGKKKVNLLTFSEMADRLRQEWHSRLRIEELSEKTVENYCIWINVLEKVFGNKMLSQITKQEIVEYRNNEAEKNSAVSANKYLKILKMVFKHGAELNVATGNPTESVRLLSEKKHERNTFILPSDIDRLIEASQNTRAKYYLPAIILLGAEHGASKQEILSLVWSKIRFDWDGKGIITLYRTKNKKERTVYLMPRTKKALLSWKEHQAFMRHRKKIQYNGSDRVFCRLDGEPLKGFYKAWRETCNRAGIKDFHFHDLRHTFGSNLLLSGATLKDVKEMIGHNDISMTDRYSHLTLNHKLRLQETLAEHYLKKAVV